MRLFALMGVTAVVGMFSAAACTIKVNDDDGAGGTGGVGGAADGGGGTTSQGGSGGTGDGGAGGGQGGSGGAASCDTCSAFVQAGTGAVEGRFCGENQDLTCEPGSSCESFASLYDCVCEGGGQGGAGGGGTCATECQATLCGIQPLDSACENCLIQDLGGTCGGLYSACLAN